MQLFKRLFRKQDSDEELAANQRSVADTFVDTALRVGGYHFDYSEASVGLLDEYADRLWDPSESPTEAELDSLTKLMGAYLGEVMIRNVGGVWRWNPDGRYIPIIEGDPGRIAHVMDRAYRRQVHGRDESFVPFYEAWRDTWSARTT